MTAFRLGVSTLETDTLEGAPAVITGAASLSGTGTQTVSAVVSVLAASTLSGTGTLSSASLVDTFGSSAQSATGSLVASAFVQTFSTASLDGNSALSDTGTVHVFADSTLTGTGTLTASATVVAPAPTPGGGSVTRHPRLRHDKSRSPVVVRSGLVWLVGRSNLSAAAVVDSRPREEEELLLVGVL